MKYLFLLLLCAGGIFPAIADTTISAQSVSKASDTNTAASGVYNNLEVLITYNGSSTLPDCIDWQTTLECVPGSGDYNPGSKEKGNSSCRAAATAKPKYTAYYFGTCNQDYTLTATMHGHSDNGQWVADVNHIDTVVPARGAGCSAVVRNPVHANLTAGGTASVPLVTSVTGNGGSLTFKPSAISDDPLYHGLLHDNSGQPSVMYVVTGGPWDTDHWTATLGTTQLEFTAPKTAQPGDSTGNLTATISCD